MDGLNAQQSFRLGFLLRCAEEGLNQDQIRERVKFAGAGGLLGPMGQAAKALMMAPVNLSLLGIGAGGIAGAGVGYGLAKAQNQAVDPEEAKRQELIAAYKMQADRARRRAQQRNYRRPAPAAPRLMD